MKNLTLANICVAAHGQYFGEENLLPKEIREITIDSRTVGEEYLFIPIKGEKVDGHDFIEKAFQKGAICVLSERKLSEEYEPYILVDSTLQALKDIAEFYREGLKIKVIGVTGSVGKTSTKEIISSVLSQKYNVLKTLGNYNNEIGLPLTIFRIKEEHDIAVLEMGISDFGEMHRLSKIAKPDICVLTNISPCHLENLKTLEGVLKAKSEIFDFMAEDGVAFINGDDPQLSTIKLTGNRKLIKYGFEQHNDFIAKDIHENGLRGISFTIRYADQTLNSNIPIPGTHNIYNALAATAIGKLLELNNQQIQSGIQSVEAVTGRVNIIHTGHLTIIDDCYNANPVSMKASIDVLTKASTRKVCIMGDMFELGENTEQLHFEIGRYAGDKEIDVLICIGNLAKHIFDGAKEHKNKFYFINKEDFIENCNTIIKEMDTILIKASHGMHFENLVEKIKNFI